MRGRGNSRQQPKPPTFPAAMNALLSSVNSNLTCAPSTPALQRRLHRREAKQRNVAPLWVLGDTTFFRVAPAEAAHTRASPSGEQMICVLCLAADLLVLGQMFLVPLGIIIITSH